MTLLQILTMFSSSPLLNIEIVLIALVIIFQLLISIRLHAKIKNLQSVFQEKLFIIYGYIEKRKIGNSSDFEAEITYDEPEDTTGEMVKLSLVETQSTNIVMVRIAKSLNSYLINNYGAAVNFSIIKDIIDREVDVEDEGITQNISTPLYMGLAATMIGIILGLWAMPNLDGDEFSKGLGSLIDGVKAAMIASFIGLVCTTILTAFFYKKAKQKVLEDKNRQLSYLQSKLLPELVRAEDTGVSGLKASLDRFAREATKISDNVRIAADRTENTVMMQLEIIDKVKDLNMTKVSKINLELFDRLETNIQSFDKFSIYLKTINKISENLVQFSNKTEVVETIADEIKSTLQDSKDLAKFLTIHFQQIEKAGGAALTALSISDSHFKEALEKLTNEVTTIIDLAHSQFKDAIELLKTDVDNRINELNSKADDADSIIKEKFDNIGTNLNNITAAHLDKLTVAYNSSVPHFEQLENLNLLPELGDKSASQSKELINAVNLLNTSLGSLGEKINNQSVLDKLDEIEKNLKRRTTTVKQFAEPKPKIEFFKRIRNSFRHKKEMSNEEE